MALLSLLVYIVRLLSGRLILLLTIPVILWVSGEVTFRRWHVHWDLQQAATDERMVVMKGEAERRGEAWVVTTVHPNQTLLLLMPRLLVEDRLHVGDSVIAMGLLTPPDQMRNPGAFDVRDWMIRERLSGRLLVERIHIIHTHRSSPFDAADHPFPDGPDTMRARLQQRIHGLFEDPDVRALMQAMLTGERSDLSEDLIRLFRRVGLSHLLAISGLHFGIILGMIWLMVGSVVSRLPFTVPWRRWVVAGVVVIAAAGYASMVGWSSSVTRSFIMATMTSVGMAANRWGWLERTLLAAALLITLMDPWAWQSLGMRLSFGAVSGIAISLRLQRLFGDSARAKSPFVSSLMVSAGAFAGTAPFLLSGFGWLSVVGLFVSPPAIVLTTFALTSAATAVLLPVGGDLLAEMASMGMEAVILLARWASTLPFPVVEGSPFRILLSVLVPLSAVFIARPSIRSFHRFIATLVGISAVIWILTPVRHVAATWLDVGQGDAMILSVPGSDPWVIDTGPGPRAGDIIADALLQGGNFQASVLLTHADIDHTGGLPGLVARVDMTTVRAPWINQTKTAGEFEVLRAGDRLPLPSLVRGYVLHPFEPGRENAHSIVTLIVFGKQALLLTGDIHAEQERAIIQQYGPLLHQLNVVALKAPHHGSKTSSSTSFLERVQPEMSVISAGRSNRFGHPDPQVLTRYRSAGIPVNTTAEHGAIQVRLYPCGFEISTPFARL